MTPHQAAAVVFIVAALLVVALAPNVTVSHDLSRSGKRARLVLRLLGGSRASWPSLERSR
jgi:hypothetical protein